MQQMPMLKDYFPDGTLDGGIGLINRLDWGLRVRITGDGWVVSSGEETLFRTDSKESLESFLYGFALPYVVLPEKLFRQLEQALQAL